MINQVSDIVKNGSIAVIGLTTSIMGSNLDMFIKISSPYLEFICRIGAVIITLLTIIWLTIKIFNWKKFTNREE